MTGEEWRRLENPVSGETFTFVETAEETGGARLVTHIEVQPGGGPPPHAHRPTETFELVDGRVELLYEGMKRILEPGEQVTVVPPLDFERTMRVLAGLARDGRLSAPGERPKEPALMANLAVRGGYYEPVMPRLVWNVLNGVLAPFGKRAAEAAFTRYDREHPSPGERIP